ncbi:hypothetical protein AX774_g1550 [Zancudomyces culisetae]|uniref:Uncharacterized protein n=1 Tax=Zancudomyces culisetae TaxID=1213189 RepID=A0A1R1PVD5_ZANCU|nr:hypothetical protein AX774_g1550 [Zancudomyces culisetae]|eukprot:OMH84913.1 hypothetical protein AX774_g1550 [Zancudomyces culisetae]
MTKCAIIKFILTILCGICITSIAKEIDVPLGTYYKGEIKPGEYISLNIIVPDEARGITTLRTDKDEMMSIEDFETIADPSTLTYTYDSTQTVNGKSLAQQIYSVAPIPTGNALSSDNDALLDLLRGRS